LNAGGGRVRGRYDKGNYGANYGGGWANENTGSNGFAGQPGWAAGGNRGVFSSREAGNRRYGAPLADMIDGTSQSVAVAEIITWRSNGDCRGCWGRNLGSVFSAYTGHTPNSGPQGIATPNVPAVGNFRDFSVYCGNNNEPKVACGDETNDGRGGVASRSYHPGGVQVAMSDGSVTFVNDSIEQRVWRALLTIQGTEAIPDF
jgi:hypothetical protein